MHDRNLDEQMNFQWFFFNLQFRVNGNVISREFRALFEKFLSFQLLIMFDRLPYIVGGQRSKFVLSLQNPYSLQNFIMEVLPASLIWKSSYLFN